MNFPIPNSQKLSLDYMGYFRDWQTRHTFIQGFIVHRRTFEKDAFNPPASHEAYCVRYAQIRARNRKGELPAGGRAFSDFEVTRLTKTTPDDWE
jgi:hypothetical protein